MVAFLLFLILLCLLGLGGWIIFGAFLILVGIVLWLIERMVLEPTFEGISTFFSIAPAWTHWCLFLSFLGGFVFLYSKEQKKHPGMKYNFETDKWIPRNPQGGSGCSRT